MLNDYLWIKNATLTHPNGIGWSSITPENAIPLLHSPVLGVLYPSNLALGMVWVLKSVSEG